PEDTPALAPGPVITTSGEVVGEHDGYARYTVGQRRGLPGGFRQPMYVIGISTAERAVVIGTADELYGHRVELSEVNWLTEPFGPGDTCSVQVRYRTRAVPARIADAQGQCLTLELAEPVRAITPGQSGVLYDGSRLLGGGLIS
ncbi:MAG: tRNA 2-thiouridine(34) synthase MnmA, partial [Gemmatimonadetes bacterium]|nr:tRNA 2-thiouridine(34) synthase MnmA [Gemmatimonadota bacterium]